MTAKPPALKFPPPGLPEREALLGFLDWKRAAVLKTAEGLSDEQARWTPDGKLLPIAGVINHLAHVETRWVDGRYLRGPAPDANPDLEFATQSPIAEIVDAYIARRVRSNEVIRSAASLDEPCLGNPNQLSRPGLDLRF